MSVPTLVAGSERIAQRRLVDVLPLESGFRALITPFDAAPMVEAMWWHRALDSDPEHQYLRDVLARPRGPVALPTRPIPRPHRV